MLNGKLFEDRSEAGKKLAESLKKYAKESPVILALPRGGVPIGFEVAKTLGAPLNVIVTRKLGFPGNKEFGIGAIGENDTEVLDQRTLALFGLPKEYLDEEIGEEKAELNRRIAIYRQNKPLPNLKDKTVILVDDGLATGVTAKAAIEAIKKQGPKKIIFASPVCAYETVQDLSNLVDKVVCVASPMEFLSVGSWYKYFPQLSDQEVVNLLSQSRN